MASSTVVSRLSSRLQSVPLNFNKSSLSSSSPRISRTSRLPLESMVLHAPIKASHFLYDSMFAVIPHKTDFLLKWNIVKTNQTGEPKQPTTHWSVLSPRLKRGFVLSSLLFISTLNHHFQQETQTMQDSKPLVLENPEAELDDDLTGFDKSLKELKDLCSQLHYAADYCEASFINAESVHKTMVMENTKEYLSKAVVTVVDHLGSIAANLDYQISQDNSVSETEFRINGLKQRLVTCQQYSHKLALTRLCWNAKFPRFHPRYIFPPMPDLKRPIEVSRKSVTQVAAKTICLNEFEAEEEAPLFLYTCDHKPSSGLDTIDADSASVLPVRDGLSMLPKARNPFHFENTRKIKRTILSWKLKHNNDIFSFGRRSKRAT